MRYIRILVVILFMASLGLCGAAKIRERAGEDPTKPVITNETGELEISTSYEESDLLEGLKAQDEKDGDLTDQIMVGNFSQFIEPGVCNLSYVVFDSSNNAASLTRKVQFTDYHSPRFTLTEPLVYAEQEGSYTESMERLGAQDALDGDLEEWIVQTDTDLNYQRAGSYTMTVEVTNSFGDTSSVGLPIHVVSAEQRTMEILLSQSILYISAGQSIDPAAYVTDVLDSSGNSAGTDSVSADSNVDPQTPGVYEIHYEVSDGDGHAGETWLTVIVEE